MSSATLPKPASETPFKPIAYQIVHTSRGRVRLRLPHLLDSPDYPDRLQHLIQACPFVTQLWVNPQALSVVVHYRSDQISTHAFQEQLATILQRAETSTLSPHSTTALATRLGVTFQALTWHRSQPNFGAWSRDRDPASIAWSYQPSSKSFLPDPGCCKPQPPSNGEQILLALGGAASVKATAMMGKLAGEVLGLLLLGTTGMILGAEVGTFVGEVVGAELVNLL